MSGEMMRGATPEGGVGRCQGAEAERQQAARRDSLTAHSAVLDDLGGEHTLHLRGQHRKCTHVNPM